MVTFTTPNLLFQLHEIYKTKSTPQFPLYEGVPIEPLTLSDSSVKPPGTSSVSDWTLAEPQYYTKTQTHPDFHQSSPKIPFCQLSLSLQHNLNKVISSIEGEDSVELLEWLNEFAEYSNTPIQMSNLRFPNDKSPLYLATASGLTSKVKLLLERCALDLDYPTKDGETALSLACLEGYLDIVQLLLEFGANPSLPTTYGTTPLHRACGNDHLEVVRTLVQLGPVDRNAQDSTGVTPLMVAATRNCRRVVNYLLQLENPTCNLSLTDTIGETAYSIAANDFNFTLCGLLEQAELRATESQGQPINHPTQLIYKLEVQKSKVKPLYHRLFTKNPTVEFLPYQPNLESYTFDLSTTPLPNTPVLSNRSKWVWASEWSIVPNSLHLEGGWVYAKTYSTAQPLWSPTLEGLPHLHPIFRKRVWVRVASQLPKF